ncbi:MAG: transposase [Magnetococcales bacterium]|nr:transposase [Magnetococcales bacterium]
MIAVLTTSNDVSDAEVLPELLDQTDDPIHQVSTDGAYDTKECHDAIQKRGARVAIPPRENAVLWPNQPGDIPHPRSTILGKIRSKGRKE